MKAEGSSGDEQPTCEVIEFADPAAFSDPRFQDDAIRVLERGDIVLLPTVGFELSERERRLIADDAIILPGRKEKESDSGRPTLIFDRDRGRIERTNIARRPRRELESMMQRFGAWADDLVATLTPGYVGAIERERVTYRPCKRNRAQALHIDSSYGHPSQGRGMLRVFCNIDGSGRARVWQVGERFEPFVARFLPTVPTEIKAGVATLLRFLGITRGQQTHYDRLMAEIRRLAKDDEAYQQAAPRRIVEFPPGATWMAITDLVVHGAMSGQHSLDQTYFLPVAAMRDPSRSSLRILERLRGRALT